jgi:hypothetical protein
VNERMEVNGYDSIDDSLSFFEENVFWEREISILKRKE